MFTKILAGLDRSEIGKQVFSQALALARQMNAKLMLLHVLSVEETYPDAPMYSSADYYPIFSPQNYEFYQQQWEKSENEGMQMLLSYVNEAKNADVNVEFQQIIGSPGRNICELASNWGADLIIVGRRGRSSLTELFLGSVSNYVLHHACCSVLTVHRQLTGK